MNEEINKYLTEAMGECWHKWDFQFMPFKCIKCKEFHPERGEINNNFATWEGFGKLFTWAKDQRWWIDFILNQNPGVVNFCKLLTPEEFYTILYKFLRRTR